MNTPNVGVLNVCLRAADEGLAECVPLLVYFDSFFHLGFWLASFDDFCDLISRYHREAVVREGHNAFLNISKFMSFEHRFSTHGDILCHFSS